MSYRRASAFCLSMIVLENRCARFRITL